MNYGEEEERHGGEAAPCAYLPSAPLRPPPLPPSDGRCVCKVFYAASHPSHTPILALQPSYSLLSLTALPPKQKFSHANTVDNFVGIRQLPQ